MKAKNEVARNIQHHLYLQVVYVCAHELIHSLSHFHPFIQHTFAMQVMPLVTKHGFLPVPHIFEPIVVLPLVKT